MVVALATAGVDNGCHLGLHPAELSGKVRELNSSGDGTYTTARFMPAKTTTITRLSYKALKPFELRHNLLLIVSNVFVSLVVSAGMTWQGNAIIATFQ